MVSLAKKIHAAVIVTRVSTGEQVKHGTSLESQLPACRAKAFEMGLPVVGEYRDAGVSGTLLLTRQGMQAAIADIRAGRADTLITLNMDRYSRSVEHQRRIKREVEEVGGQIVFCDMSFDNSPEGDFAFTIVGAAAEMEKKKIRARTLGGKLTRIEQGIQPSRAMRPFGYLIVTRLDVLSGRQDASLLGKYLALEPEAEWARQIFARYAQGASLAGLARWLQESGVLPIRGAKVWHANTLCGILRNPVYKGLATYGKRRRIVDESRLQAGFKRPDYNPRLPEEEWRYIPAPALVPEETWNQVQERLRDNHARLSGNNQRRHALTGLLHCPVCGRNMRSKKTRQYVHFHCRDYSAKCNLTGVVCHPKHYNSAHLEGLVSQGLMTLSACPELLEAAIETLQKRLTPKDTAAERRTILLGLASLEEKERAVVKAQIAGVQAGADVAAYGAVFGELAAQRAALRKRLTSLPEVEVPASLSAAELAAQVSERVARLEEVLGAPELPADKKHALLAMLVDSLVPDGDDGLRIVLKVPVEVGGQTVRLIVIRRSGKSSPVFLTALRTRSRDSCTAVSGRPTILNMGRLEDISTSTRTIYASIPSIALESTCASICKFSLPGVRDACLLFLLIAAHVRLQIMRVINHGTKENCQRDNPLHQTPFLLLSAP